MFSADEYSAFLAALIVPIAQADAHASLRVRPHWSSSDQRPDCILIVIEYGRGQEVRKVLSHAHIATLLETRGAREIGELVGDEIAERIGRD